MLKNIQKSRKMKRMIITILIILLCIYSLLGTFQISNAAYTQNKKTGIDAFPESYQVYLKKLAELHPNWNFTAFNTGMSWNEFLNKETSEHLRNTVINSSDSLWKDSCGKTASGYTCASKDIVAYFADPRNFLTESGIFQFLEMSYNSSAYTKEGVQSILKGTFMDKTITVSEETQTVSINAKIDGSYIIVTPNTKLNEAAKTVKIDKYKILNSAGKEVANTEKAITGYKFTDTAKNVTYTVVVLGDVNGDGQVKSTDYMKIKNFIMGETQLNDMQKKAADVNRDGEAKSTDYMKIKNYIMNSTPITIEENNGTTKVTMSYADIIMKAAQEAGISPYSIAIKIIQEVGRQGSSSVSGTYPGYEGYYNFFNVGASDGGNAIENGLKYAKEKGWNNQYISIVEGAKFLADSYIGVGQNTAYFYKWDVVDDPSNGTFWHQYMTNIQDPSSQAKTLYNTYAKNNILDISLNFIIPVYNNMPSACNLPSAIDKNAPTSYYVNGTGVNVRSGPTTSASSIGTLSLNEIVTVEVFEYKNADGYTWAKIKRANGSTGYVANRYLTKCN